jgi:PAS domain S-box-containing protein
MLHFKNQAPKGSQQRDYHFFVLRLQIISLILILLAFSSPQAIAEHSPPPLINLTQDEKTWLAQTPNITVANKYGWAPIEFMPESGEIRGISVDYLRRMEPMLGIRFRLQGSGESLANETADILSATHKTPDFEDSRFQTLEPPFITNTFVVYSKKDGPHYKNLSELKGKKVAAFKTGVVAKMLAQHHPDIVLYPADIAEEALEALLTDKVDAYIGNPLIVNHVAQTQGMANIVMSGDTPYRADIYMAVRNDWPLLASAMSKALDAVYEQDRREIMDRWESVSYAYDINYPLIIGILFGSAIIMAFFYGSNRRLHLEIVKRMQIEDSLIKARKKAENAEQTIRNYTKEIERLALVATKTLNAVMITDADGYTIWVNPAFTRNTGYSFDDVLGKKPGALLQGPETSADAIKYMRESIHNRQDCVVEIINYKKNGEIFWVNLSIAAIQNSSGENLYIAVQNDITSQKNFIEHIEHQRADMDAMFSLNPDGIVVISREDQVGQVNQAFIKLVGMPSNALIGLDIEALDDLLVSICKDPDQYRTMRSDLDTMAEAEDNPLIPLSRQFETIDDAGPHIIQRSLVHASQPRVKGVFYFRDITQETMLNRMKTEFISTAAHELRTPMSVILGYAELLYHKNPAEDLRREMLQSILQKSNSVVELLNDLLDMAKIEDRTTKTLHLQHQPISPLLKTIADTFITSKNQNRVVLQIRPPLPEFLFDKQKIERAINNCLSNAYKFSPNASLIYMRAEHIHNKSINEIVISVIDSGIGMKPDQLARVFEKFYRADQSGNIPGTGLGMALVKEIIEAHGGRVEVESIYCLGTTISLHLPVTKDRPLVYAA